jgi:hypothetical protein
MIVSVVCEENSTLLFPCILHCKKKKYSIYYTCAHTIYMHVQLTIYLVLTCCWPFGYIRSENRNACKYETELGNGGGAFP